MIRYGYKNAERMICDGNWDEVNQGPLDKESLRKPYVNGLMESLLRVLGI